MSTHIIAGRHGAMPVGYVPRDTPVVSESTPAATPIDRAARAEIIAQAAQKQAAEHKPPEVPEAPKVRAVAVMPPKPPEASPRVIRNADVIAVLPETEKAAMSRGDIANVMGLRGVEVDRLDNALTRLRKSGVAKVTKKRGGYAYYRLTADEARDVVPPRWQAILDILPDDPANGIPMTEVVEKFNAATGEQASKLAIKSMIEKLMMRRMVGPQHKVGTGYLRLYYRISGGNAMNAAIDPTIATLAHDRDLGEHITHGTPSIPYSVTDEDDGDISDAVAALEADTQARDLREESIEDEAPDVLPFEHEWANVSLHELLTEMHKRRSRIERDMQMVKDISSATLGLTTMEAVDLLEWLSKRLIESHEQRHADLKGRTAG